MNRISLFFILILSCSAQEQKKNKNGKNEPARQAVCFVYHRFGDARYPATNTKVSDFESHLIYLTSQHYTVLSFSQAIDYLRSDGQSKKVAVITIDDGYKSFFKNGLPLLKKYNLPATLFINTKTVGGGDYMTWSDLEVAMKNKIEIGNHTHTHNYFLNEPVSTRYETFKDEIELSQSIILKHLHVTAEVFSYPYGEFDTKMKSIVKEAGFKAAAAQNSGVIHSLGDLYQCPRFPMSESYSSKNKFIDKALMNALSIKKEGPDNFILPKSKRPSLTLTFARQDLKLEQMQCFVQGGTCTLKIQEKTDETVTVTLQADKKIASRRRTLYTLTIPDAKGNWYWHSHLWINEKIVQ
jgi:peptidoglycan/xylan/chitin deacetylase (PgdA/CDA1 family)